MTEPSDKPESPPESSQTPPPPHQPPPPYPYPAGPYPGVGYPPPPPQPYAGWTPPPTGPKNGLGIASLVIAIVGLVLVWSVFGGVILGTVAIVIGFVAHGRVRRGEANNGGVAIAGIVLGVLALVGGLAFIAIWVGVFNQVGGSSYVDCLRNAGSDQTKIQQCADQFRQHVENQFSVTLTPSP